MKKGWFKQLEKHLKMECNSGVLYNRTGCGVKFLWTSSKIVLISLRFNQNGESEGEILKGVFWSNPTYKNFPKNQIF